MKMQIVKFKNGKYGVRRRLWWSFKYQYLSTTGSTDCWFLDASNVVKYCQGTREEIDSAIERRKQFLNRIREIDSGTSIEVIKE